MNKLHEASNQDLGLRPLWLEGLNKSLCLLNSSVVAAINKVFNPLKLVLSRKPRDDTLYFRGFEHLSPAPVPLLLV
ncbi:hypothetical protein Ciccas_014429 [Cichlidogyrus casuarinus]|uniref:Uncharacterized protein n=1 Tax=Cichlidogyrus casuarinus TaxID=1844966 RepID=A0ABD2PI91_9PLAT